MSPRPAKVLRDAPEGRTIRDHLIETAARLLGERGSAGLTVRDIAREAGVADGALYNHFADKHELLARALEAHVQAVMHATTDLPKPGTATVAANLRAFLKQGMTVLQRVTPAFAGFLDQREVIAGAGDRLTQGGRPIALPLLITEYLEAERELGRIADDTSIRAVATLLVGACHDFVLPRVFFNPDAPSELPADDVLDDLVRTIMDGIAPPTAPVASSRRRYS